jgi:ABC-type glycerol-3-phosphate transport system substrate-binding protein
VKKNAPDVSFKVYALPCGKTCSGAGNLFPWTNMVYKSSPNKQVAWDFVRFISNAKDDLDQHQAQGILPVWTILIVFLVCQKWVVRGVVMSGLKG